MLDQHKYKTFSQNDFISDPCFQDWVINAGKENDLFWSKFFEANPEKKEAGELARNFLINIRFKEDFPEDRLIRRSLEKHIEHIERLENSKVIHLGRRFPVKKLLRIAAIFGGVVLLLFALSIFNNKDKHVFVKTEFGNMKSVILPDSSHVVLNANSKIRFDRSWDNTNGREVWLEGEAFFDVRRINKDSNNMQRYEQFVVHLEELTVEVLGTSFDIRQRREKTEVVLQTGKIKISFKDKRTKDIIMKPGDKLLYDATVNKLETTSTIAEDFSAWKEKKLILDDPTAAEIVEYLEDNFGKEIILEKPDLGKRKIEGPILLTNLEDALFILSTVLNTEIIREDSTIIIRPR